MVFILQLVNVVSHWFWIYWKILHPWDKSHWIMVCDPFAKLFESFGSILLCFFPLYSSMILVCNLFFVVSLSGFISGWLWPHRMSLGVFCSSEILEILSEEYMFSLNVWKNLPVKPYHPGLLVFSSFLNHNVSLRTCDWSSHIFCFFLVQSWKVAPFQEVVDFF